MAFVILNREKSSGAAALAFLHCCHCITQVAGFQDQTRTSKSNNPFLQLRIAAPVWQLPLLRIHTMRLSETPRRQLRPGPALDVPERI